MTKLDDSSVVSVHALRRDLGKRPSYLEARSVKRGLLQEQQAGWDNDAPIPPEDLLARWPTDAADDPFAVAVVYEDMLRRRKSDDELSVADYAARYPAQGQALATVVNQQAAIRSAGGVSRNQNARLGLPNVGDEVFGFHLKGDSGTGLSHACFWRSKSRSRIGRWS